MSAPPAVHGPILAEPIAAMSGKHCTWPSEQPGSLEASIAFLPTEPAPFTAANDFTHESDGPVVLISYEGVRVAYITPYFIDRQRDYRAAENLIRSGIVDPPSSPSDVESLLAAPNPSLPNGVSASRLISAERDIGW